VAKREGKGRGEGGEEVIGVLRWGGVRKEGCEGMRETKGKVEGDLRGGE